MYIWKPIGSFVHYKRKLIKLFRLFFSFFSRTSFNVYDMQNTIVKHDAEVWLQVLYNSFACRHGAPGLNTPVTVINKKFWLTASPPLRHGQFPQALIVFGIVNEWIPLKNQSQISVISCFTINVLGCLGGFSFFFKWCLKWSDRTAVSVLIW